MSTSSISSQDLPTIEHKIPKPENTTASMLSGLSSELWATEAGQRAGSHTFRFPRFSELPREIRDIIWESTLPDARVIEIFARGPYKHGGLASRLPPVDCKPNPSGCQNSHPTSGKWQKIGQEDLQKRYLHPALSVCRESRELALRNYAWCFSSRSAPKDPERLPWDNGIVPCCKLWTPGILFQPNRDTIYLQAANYLPGVDIELAIISAFAEELDCTNIRTVAIEAKLFQDVALFVALFQGNYQNRPPLMKGLKKVLVIKDWCKPTGSRQGVLERRFDDRTSTWKMVFENNTTITPVPTFSCVDKCTFRLELENSCRPSTSTTLPET